MRFGELLVRSFLRSLSEKRCLVVVTTAEERVKSDTLWKDEQESKQGPRDGHNVTVEKGE